MFIDMAGPSMFWYLVCLLFRFGTAKWNGITWGGVGQVSSRTSGLSLENNSAMKSKGAERKPLVFVEISRLTTKRNLMTGLRLLLASPKLT